MKPAEPLYAVQHIRRMRGGSQAHLIRASDNNLYVTKFQNNPQHIRVLASEYLGTRLGSFLGLPMPEVRILDVSEWLIAHTPELRIEIGGVAVACCAGQQLGSRYVADPENHHIFDYLPDPNFERLRNRDDFTRVLAFDKWTCNADGRQAVFVKRREERLYQAVFIDQGYCFNAGEWTFPDQPLRGVYARNSAYYSVTGWDSFEPVLSQIEAIQRTDVEELASEIPLCWYENDDRGLSLLIDSLISRRGIVRDLIISFRNSSRQPFPNWLGA
jgi:hypothetical protein